MNEQAVVGRVAYVLGPGNSSHSKDPYTTGLTLAEERFKVPLRRASSHSFLFDQPSKRFHIHLVSILGNILKADIFGLRETQRLRYCLRP